jgi:hypothetical protein
MLLCIFMYKFCVVVFIFLAFLCVYFKGCKMFPDLFILWYWGLNPAPHKSWGTPLALLFVFCFWDRVLLTLPREGLRLTILLTSPVARMTIIITAKIPFLSCIKLSQQKAENRLHFLSQHHIQSSKEPKIPAGWSSDSTDKGQRRSSLWPRQCVADAGPELDSPFPRRCALEVLVHDSYPEWAASLSRLVINKHSVVYPWGIPIEGGEGAPMEKSTFPRVGPESNERIRQAGELEGTCPT